MKPAILIRNRLQYLGAVLLLSVVIFIANDALAQDNSLAQELLSRMSSSLREVNYRGKFTFEVADSAIETYQITHWSDESGEQEILTRLNGPEKTIVRENPTTNCLALGDKILRGSLGNIHPSDQLFNNYSLYLRGEHRIANRTAYLLHLVPHDVYRNGQTIAVDKDTFLPLQRQWFSPDSKLIERMQFVELEVGITPEAAEQSVSPTAPVLRSDNTNCNTAEDSPGRVAWAANWLPKGFFLTHVGGTGEGESMLSYTDGLASFSVFVRERPVSVMVQGNSDRGATVAFVGNRMWQQKPFRITVIGEIPLLTAQKVVAALTPVDQ